LQSIELPKKPAALSHTNSFAVAANAQCNNNNNKKQSNVRSESVFFSQWTRSPTGDSSGGQTNQRNAEQQQAFNRKELAEEQDNSKDNSESCSA
jgi:hypothetical protein